MDNMVFERDYSKACKEAPNSNWIDAMLVQALTDSFLTSYTDAMKAVPKVIIPEYQANYEYVLRLCDDLAESWGGSIRGEISYEQWEATIDLVLPYVEFTSPKDLQFLQEIAEKSHGVSIQPVDGSIHIHIINRYFEDLISNAERTYMAYECIMNDIELSEFINYLIDFLNTVEKNTGRDRRDILIEFLMRVGDLDGVEDVHKAMKDVAEAMIDESRSQR